MATAVRGWRCSTRLMFYGSPGTLLGAGLESLG
jgi:hypothetical protein